jgi:branched-chain amino acid transport system substrate-binding protein
VRRIVMQRNHCIECTSLVAALVLLFATEGLAVPHQIVIGHPACLSGKHTKAGEQAVGGIQAIVDWVNTAHGGVTVEGNKVPLEYIYYDSESRKDAVTSLITRLITADKVDAIMAPYSSGLTLRGAPVAESRQMLYMDHGGANDEIFQQGFQYVVQTIGPASRYHEGTLDMIQTVDPQAKRVALAYEDSEFARMVMAGTEAQARKLGLKIVFKRTYPKNVTDLTPLLSALKGSNPEFVIGGGHFEDGQLFNRQMADLGIDVKALSLIAAATLPAFYEALTHMAEGVMGPSHWEYGVKYSEGEAKRIGLSWFGPSQDEFVELFKKALGRDIMPDYHAAEAGAAVLSYVLAVEKANSVDTTKVRKALADLEFMSFYGGWDIDETGLQVGHSMVDVQWQMGRRVIVWPPEAQTGRLAYPMPTFAEKAKGKMAVQR